VEVATIIPWDCDGVALGARDCIGCVPSQELVNPHALILRPLMHLRDWLVGEEVNQRRFLGKSELLAQGTAAGLNIQPELL